MRIRKHCGEWHLTFGMKGVFLTLLLVGIGAGSPALAQRGAMLVGVGSHGNANEAGQLASLGSLTRVTFYLQKDNAQYRREFAARLVDLRTHRLDVMTVVHDFGRDTVQQMVSLATSFRGMTWQVLNEADARRLTGATYARLMSRMVPAVRAVDATARFVSMGLSSTDGQPWAFSPDTVRLVAFTRAYLDANGPMLDAWCVHVYGLPLNEAVSTRVRAVRGILNGRMPICISEMGVDRAHIERVLGKRTTAAIDSIQAREIENGLAAAQREGVTRVWLYQLWTNDDDGFGVLRANAKTERPVAAAIRRFTARP